MLQLTYLYRNLTRNFRRTLLTLAAVGLPISIFVLSLAVITGIETFLNNSVKQLRLAVTQKASIVNPLPWGHRAKIESLDPAGTRLVAVCAMEWIGGKIQDVSQPLSTVAADHDTFVATFPEYSLTEDEIAAWNRDRRAVIVGRRTAAQLGWGVGARITIKASLPPYTDIELNVISTAERASDPVTIVCRRDYIEEVMKVPGWPEDLVGWLFVKCATKDDLDYFRVAIDGLFARTPDETKTQDEKAFMNEFITQQFNLPRNLTILAAVTIFVAVMAGTNTMSMNFRDRLSEIAIMKSLGFRGPVIFGMIQAESLLLCGLGGLLGAGIPYIAFMHTPLKTVPIPVIMTLEIPRMVCAQAMLIALLIGTVAAAWPSWSAMRMTVVNALRNLE